MHTQTHLEVSWNIMWSIQHCAVGSHTTAAWPSGCLPDTKKCAFSPELPTHTQTHKQRHTHRAAVNTNFQQWERKPMRLCCPHDYWKLFAMSLSSASLTVRPSDLILKIQRVLLKNKRTWQTFFANCTFIENIPSPFEFGFLFLLKISKLGSRGNDRGE